MRDAKLGHAPGLLHALGHNRPDTIHTVTSAFDRNKRKQL
jgi:hypothetical protein